MKVICPNFSNKQVAKEFNELKSVIGENAAYYVWSCNNGYAIDSAPNGAESILFKELLQKYNGDRVQAIREKASTYLKGFLRKNGDWLNGNSDILVDTNGEPVLNSYAEVDVHEENKKFNETKEHILFASEYGQFVQQQNIQEKHDRYVQRRAFHKHKIKQIKNGLMDQLIQAYNLKWSEDKDGHRILIKQDGSRPNEFAVVFLDSLSHDVLSDDVQQHDNTVRKEILKDQRTGHPGKRKGLFYDDGDRIGSVSNIIMMFLNNNADANTFSHELAHSYLKTFWDTDLVQEAVRHVMKVYDIRTSFVAEEKLVQLMEQEARRTNYRISNDKAGRKRTDSYIQKFWNRLTSAIKNMFSSKEFKIDDSNREKIIHYCTQAFLVNYDANLINVQRTVEENLIHIRGPKFQTATQNSIAKDIYKRTERLLKSYQYRPSINVRQQKHTLILQDILDKMGVANDAEAIDLLIDYAYNITNIRNGVDLHKVDNPTWAEWFEMVMQAGYKDYQTAPLDAAGQIDYSKAKPIDAQTLVDLQDSIIGFIKNTAINVIVNYKQNNKLTPEQELKFNHISATINDMNNKLLCVMYVTTDNMVDEFVDKNVGIGDKSIVKKVWKDWLHRQSFTSDIGYIQKMLGLYSHSSNGIIRMSYTKVQDAEMKISEVTQEAGNKLLRLYKAANKKASILNLIAGNWQTMYVEVDDNGDPTGYFIRKENHGKFMSEMAVKQQELFDKYHLHYNEDNELVDALGTPVEQQTWFVNASGQNEAPPYIKYLRDMNDWLSKHAVRRYTKNYYDLMYSAPATETSVGQYGLSPDTIFAQRRLSKQVSKYLQSCTKYNPITKQWEQRLEDLTDDEYSRLLQAKQALEQLANIYELDGSKKTGDKYRMAIELSMFNAITQSNSEVKYDFTRFEQDRANFQGSTQDFYKWLYRNSDISINPLIFQDIFDGKPKDPFELARYKRYRSYLKKLAPTNTGELCINLNPLINNVDFFMSCKDNDIEIEQLQNSNPQSLSKNAIDKLSDTFTDKLVPYYDKNNKPTNESFLSRIIEHYTDEIMSGNTQILQKNNISNADIQAAIANGRDFVKQVVNMIFTYEHTDSKGNTTRVPLSIFTFKIPTNAKYTLSNGKTVDTVVYKPKGRYSETVNKSMQDDRYDKSKQESIQPDPILYHNKQFDKLMNNDKEFIDLYKYLIKYMRDSFSKLQGNIKFDYRLPQIEGSGFQNIQRGGLGKNISQLWRLKQDDTELQYGGEQAFDPAGNPIKRIPTRFLSMLDDDTSKFINQDLVSTVTQFVEMAENNYQKNKLLPEILLLQRQLLQENRKSEDRIDSTYLSRGKGKPGSSQNSYENMNTLIETQLYGERSTTFSKNKTDNVGKGRNAKKIMSTIKSIGSVLMLGLNTTSALIGYGDATLSHVIEALCGKYMTKKDFMFGMFTILRYIPHQLFNLEARQANNKLAALMRLNRIGRGNSEIFNGIYSNRLRKFMNRHLLMGGFTLGDYMANSLIMSSFYHHQRFIKPGTTINGFTLKPGFYSQNELISLLRQNGSTKRDAKNLYSNLSDTLWDAYEFVDGELKIKDWAKPYITSNLKTRIREKIIDRTALYNGVLPSNEISAVKQNIYLSTALLMRGFFILFGVDRFQIGNDYIERAFDEHGKPKDLTQQQKDARGFYNISTGEVEYGTAIMAYSAMKKFAKSLIHPIKTISHLLSAPPDTSMYTDLERYGLKSILCQLTALAILFGTILYIRGTASDNDDDDLKGWSSNMAYLLALRMFEARSSSIDITQVRDLITGVTVLTSPEQDLENGFGLIFNASMSLAKYIAEQNNLDIPYINRFKSADEEIEGKSAYKGMQVWQRDLLKLTPFSNIFEQSRVGGLKATQRFYESKVPFIKGMKQEKLRGGGSDEFGFGNDLGFDSGNDFEF